MRADRRVVSLLSDSGTEYDGILARELPKQCFNFGISEQNQVGVAAGMAMCGKIPFVFTNGAFLAYRAYEFIRNDVCGQNLNVKLIGVGSGTSWSTLGTSHHTTEDFAALRVLPNLTILSPATPAEAAACIKTAYEHTGPVYVRLGLSGEREYYGEGTLTAVGECHKLGEGDAAAVFVTGSILSEVMECREILLSQGISIEVYDMYSIRPLDGETVKNVSKRFRTVFSVEEHSVNGGLGGAMAEILAEQKNGARLVRFGMENGFAVGYGSQSDIRRTNRLDAASLAARIGEALKNE